MARTIDGASFADAPAKAALLPMLRAAMPPPVRTAVELRQELPEQQPPSSASESSTATLAATSTVVHDTDLDGGETSACAALLLSAAAWARSGSAYAGETLAAADTAGDARAGAFIDEDDLAAERSERLGLDAAGSDRVAPFLTKLYDLVSHPGTDDIVRWTEDGSAFRIVDAQRLSTEVLPRYFKHNKLGSLTQQLHTYGFVRHNGEANALGQMVFSREFFRANAASELSRIRRGFPAYRPDEPMRTDELPHDGVPTSAAASAAESGTPESRLHNLQAQHSQLAQVLTALDGRFRDHKQQASYALLAIGEVLARRRPDLGSMISDILMRDDQTIGVSSPRPSNDDDEPPAPAMSVRESEGAEGATEAPHEAAEATKSADEVTAARVPQTSGATTTAPSGQLTLLPAAAEPEGTGQVAQVPAETGEHCSSGGGSDHVGDRCSEERSSGGGSDHGGGSDRASGSESPDQEGEGSDERSDSAGRSSDKSQKSGSAAGSSSGASSGAAASSSSAEPRSEPSDRSGSDGAKTSDSLSSDPPAAQERDASRGGRVGEAASSASAEPSSEPSDRSGSDGAKTSDSLSSSDSPSSKPPAAEGGDASSSGQVGHAATAGQQEQQAVTDMCIEQPPM